MTHTQPGSASFPIAGPDLSLLLLRLMLGVIGVFHGGQKLFGIFGGYGVKGTAEWMATVGIPAPTLSTVLAGSTQFFGGIFIALGLFSRFWSIGLAFAMLVAIVKVHPHAFSAQANGMEFAMSVGVMAIAVAITGPGRLNTLTLVARLVGRPEPRPHFALV